MQIIKEISFYLVVGIGLCGLIIGFLWILEKTVTQITISFKIYEDVAQFMWDKRRKKK